MARQKFMQAIVRLFEYNTAVVLHSNSKTIGITFRLLQFCIFVFIFVYYIGYKGGYQVTSYAIIYSTTIERQEVNDAIANDAEVPIHVELKSPDNIMVLTYAVIQRQEKSICPEDPRITGSTCDPFNNSCLSMKSRYGELTGNCVQSDLHYLPEHLRKSYTCEVRGWCTAEEFSTNLVDENSVALIVQNHVHFPEFAEHGHLRNFDHSLQSCWARNQFFSDSHPRCPIFKLKTVAEEAAKTSDQYFTFEDLVHTGGVISMRIMWDCNFEIRNRDDQCVVKYDFRRLDNVSERMRTNDYKVSLFTSSDDRTMMYVKGVHFLTSVEGKARKLDLFTCILKFGAGVGLFALASVVCELLLTFACCRSEQQIRSMKYVEASNGSRERINLILGKQFENGYVYV